MPVPSYLTYGNVDLPKLWASHARPGQHILDGERVDLDGWTFGFVGGGLRTTYRTPNELDDDVFAAKVEAIGEVDVLCAHIPPAVPDLLYDTVARRMERGSEALLAAIKKTQPRYVLFGHVHQPLAEPGQDRADRVHQRGPFPGQGPALRTAVGVKPSARHVRRGAGPRGTLRVMADRTSSSITVAAERSAVMGVIADFGSYPDWATGVRSAEVLSTARTAVRERVRFGLDAGVIRDSYVLAYEWDGDAAVRWQLAEAGSMVTEMSGAYVLADDGPGTKVSYELAVGTRVPMIGMLKRRAEKTIIETALKGLKSRAEIRSRDSGEHDNGESGAIGR